MTHVSHFSSTNEILWAQVQFGKIVWVKIEIQGNESLLKIGELVHMRERGKKSEKKEERKEKEEKTFRAKVEQGEM